MKILHDVRTAKWATRGMARVEPLMIVRKGQEHPWGDTHLVQASSMETVFTSLAWFAGQTAVHDADDTVQLGMSVIVPQ